MENRLCKGCVHYKLYVNKGIYACELWDCSKQWISPEKKLPKDKSFVLVTIRVGNREARVRSGFYNDGMFANDNGDFWRATDREVKAWMYAPEPFKGEEDELMRDCEHCEHYKDNGETRGCELWECDKDGKDGKDDKEYDDFDRSGSEWR